jgi:hypothetical protein
VWAAVVGIHTVLLVAVLVVPVVLVVVLAVHNMTTAVVVVLARPIKEGTVEIAATVLMAAVVVVRTQSVPMEHLVGAVMAVQVFRQALLVQQ